MKNCWEIKKCGRETGGPKSKELGVCVAAREELGHSCWMIAGTLCGGAVQGSVAQKERNCMSCEVFKKYHRTTGSEGKQVAVNFPKEQQKYAVILTQRLKAKG